MAHIFLVQQGFFLKCDLGSGVPLLQEHLRRISEKIKDSIVNSFNKESKLFNELNNVLNSKGLNLEDFINTIAYLSGKDKS